MAAALIYASGEKDNHALCEILSAKLREFPPMLLKKAVMREEVFGRTQEESSKGLGIFLPTHVHIHQDP